MAPTQPSQQDFVDLDDIDLFTNTDFFDFDLNVPADLSFTQSQQQQQQQQQPQTDGTDFQSAYYQPIAPFPATAAGTSSLPPSPPNGLPLAGPLQQSQPTVPSAAQFNDVLMPSLTTGPSQGQKRKSSSSAPVVDLEEQSRVAAEEDKRRRNTAASARFRVKKKQREQALEQTAKEMTERVAALEARVGQLETENKWLKGLLVEKDVDVTAGPPEEVVETEAL